MPEPDVGMYRTARIASKIMARLTETGTSPVEAVEMVSELQCAVLEESATVLQLPKLVGPPSEVLRTMARLLRSHTEAQLAAVRKGDAP